MKEMSPRQLTARDQLRDRGYVCGNTFADRNGNLVEIWCDRKALLPAIMLALNNHGGWELFVEPTMSNEIAETWTALDGILEGVLADDQPRQKANLTHAELEEQHELELQREDEDEERSQTSD